MARIFILKLHYIDDIIFICYFLFKQFLHINNTSNLIRLTNEKIETNHVRYRFAN